MCKSMDEQDNSASVRYMRLRLRPAGTGPNSAHAMSGAMAVGTGQCQQTYLQARLHTPSSPPKMSLEVVKHETKGRWLKFNIIERATNHDHFVPFAAHRKYCESETAHLAIDSWHLFGYLVEPAHC